MPSQKQSKAAARTVKRNAHAIQRETVQEFVQYVKSQPFRRRAAFVFDILGWTWALQLMVRLRLVQP